MPDSETFALPETTGLLIGLLALAAIAEAVFLLAMSKKASFKHHYSQVLKNGVLVMIIGAVLGRLAPFLAIAGLATIAQNMISWSLPTVWYGWITGFIIYEFWYWLQHWLGHKSRLFWCIHSSHHAPDTINLTVGFNHHFLESLVYFPIFFGFLPALCGVPVEMILVINLIDVIWGSLLHVSADVVKVRYGPLEYVLQTPRYHRVHHGRNLRYMDKNYNSMTLLWDWVMGTLQPLHDDDPVEFGITRDVDVESVMDVQFGEFRGLWQDVKAAPGLTSKLKYMFMPPGWSHTGDHKTVTALRQTQSGNTTVPAE